MPFLTARYIDHHMYVSVPHHVKEDMKWIRDCGADAIAITILEQDLYAARSNIDTIFSAAEKEGLKVFCIPSRWGGIVTGAPKVPSLFAANNPDTWIRELDGSHRPSAQGPVCSIHHPEVRQFFYDHIDRTLEGWPFYGLMFAEPKNLGRQDYSDFARRKMGPEIITDQMWHFRNHINFFDELCAYAKHERSDLIISCYVYSYYDEERIEKFAALPHIDEFGCDGRPWPIGSADGLDPHEESAKSIVSHGQRFIDACRRHGKRTQFLIENHAMPEACLRIMDKHLPDVFDLGAEHIGFYYYPREIDSPEEHMSLIRKHMQAVKDVDEKL